MNKKILIIGGTSGLGRKLAELYCQDNCMVAIVGRRKELLNDIKKQYPENIKICQADISTEEADKSISALVDELGGFDIFIFTASVIHFNETLELKKELDTIGINVNGFTWIINFAYNYCKKNNKGQIVIVTSVAASRGNKTAPAYNASKAFQSHYTEGIRLKMRSDKINATVTEIIPGYMNTDMAKGERLFWVASVEKAARQIKKGIEKKKKKIFITKRWWLVYHIFRLTPSFFYDRLINSNISFKKNKQD